MDVSVGVHPTKEKTPINVDGDFDDMIVDVASFVAADEDLKEEVRHGSFRMHNEHAKNAWTKFKTKSTNEKDKNGQKMDKSSNEIKIPFKIILQ